jgi:hypothetical protein
MPELNALFVTGILKALNEAYEEDFRYANGKITWEWSKPYSLTYQGMTTHSIQGFIHGYTERSLESN